MRGICCQLLVLALLPFALDAAQGQNQSQNAAPRRTVTGTVSNSVSGEPVRHALVQLLGIRQASVLTGADGRFQIDDVPEGQINLFVIKPGYFDTHSLPGSEWSQSRRGFTVGGGTNDFRLTLSPTARIAGRISDTDGEPVEHVPVQVLAEQILQGHRHWQAQNASMTDEDGAYRVEDLVPGRYIIFANGHALPPSSWDAPREMSVPAYYPDAPDLASAQPIEIQPGQEFHADFHLRTERGFRITGAVGGMPSSMGMGIAVENSSGQNVSFERMNVDPNRGRLVVEAVPAGTWTLVLMTNDTQGHAYEGRQEVTVKSADVTDLQILLHPAAMIPVTINHPPSASQPTSGQGPANAGVNVTLASVETSQYRQYGIESQGTPPALVFNNVVAGKYKLSTQAFGSECVDSAWYGNVDVLRDYLMVGSDGQTQPLTVNLRADCATLSAKVSSGGQRTSGFLVVVSSSSLDTPQVLLIGGQSASVTFGPMHGTSLTLSPGSYEVYAFSSLDGLEYANPDALREYPGQSINLAAGQKVEVTVELTERKGR